MILNKRIFSMNNNKVLRLKSISKINFFLYVQDFNELDKKYYIQTLFFPLKGLYDIISLQRAENYSIFCTHPEVPENEDNLCFKALKYYLKEIDNVDHKFSIHIEKNIPICAGLGGGSSNAAVTLLLLNQYYKDLLTMNQLHRIARKIGADVSFFLYQKPALAYGIGDELNFIHIQSSFHILVLPLDFPISASWAYKNYKGEKQQSISVEKLISQLEKGARKSLKLVHNDLSLSIKKKFPIVEIFLKQLLDFGAECTEISGSGPTLFAIFSNKNKLLNCKDKLKAMGYDSHYCPVDLSLK